MTFDWSFLRSAIFSIAAGSLFSALVAFATLTLAWQTRKSTAQAREQMDAEQDRHMDSLLPHIALQVNFEIEREKDGTKRTIHEVAARNVGPGFARDIQISEPDIPNVGNYIVDPRTALASGDEFVIARQEFDPDGPHLHDISVEYKDAFGRRFRSSLSGLIAPGQHYRWERLPPES
jgi:hypothetical protein